MIFDFTLKKYRGILDSKEIEEIENVMTSSVRPPEPKRKPLSLMEKIFGREKKLFESDAWKNRNIN